MCDVDADCPAGGACIDSEGYRFCLPACTVGSACPADQACLDSFNGFPLDGPACVPGNAVAQDGDACGGFFQCNAYSDCSNDVESPGGACATYGCTPGDDSPCHGGTCMVVDDYPIQGAMCVDACVRDADCRVAAGYGCYDPGDAAPYCRHPHVGDACGVDADCGDAS